MRRPQVTIKDIASYLGISHPTVSRALNDSGKISEHTKLLVRQAAGELGYVANASARMMRLRHSALIGLVIPDIRNDFYSAVARALARRCRDAGLQMLLLNTDDDPMVEHDQVRALLEARAAGIVITPTAEPLPATARLLETTSTIQFVRRSPRLGADVICMDDAVAMRQATEHLLTLGHSRIGYVGTRSDISVGQARLDGYLLAHQAAEVSVDARLVCLVSPDQGAGEEGVSRQLGMRNRPTALILGSSELTIGGLGAIRRHGLVMPEALSVVGYGDPAWLRLLSPALTAVPLPVDALVDAAMSLMLRRLARDMGVSPGMEVSIAQPGLIVRESSAPPRHGPVRSDAT